MNNSLHEKKYVELHTVTLQVQNHFLAQIQCINQSSAYTKVAGFERNSGAVGTEGGLSPGLHVRSEWP